MLRPQDVAQRAQARTPNLSTAYASGNSIIKPKEAPKPLSKIVEPHPDTTEQNIEKLTIRLNETARDLTEILESAKPTDLEKRYQRGEIEVYVQYLSAKRNKRLTRTFERLYEANKPARTRIDTYINLFERLLDAVAELPKATILTEGIIDSEVGRIYLLLAEATGRITP